MMKRILTVFLAAALTFQAIPLEAVAAQPKETGTVSISNEYLEVVVNKENGGYTIKTKEGDLIKETDNNKQLLHSGECYDSSFTSFQVGGDSGKEYVFGNRYLLSDNVQTTSDSEGITSVWTMEGIRYTQRIELVNNDASEQLGTAQVIYTIENLTGTAREIKSRVLMDTQLGDQDYAVYEAGENVLGNGFQGYVTETDLDSTKGDFIPVDYFARNSIGKSTIAAFGVNSVMETEKPYRMIFGHWANLASTKFDYTVNEGLNFTSSINSIKTADSAVAMYYDLGTVDGGESKSFSTYYGVTANLNNLENQVLINTTAPARVEFNEERTAFIGSSGQDDNLIRISTTVTNPDDSGVEWENLRVAIYAIGLSAERQDDAGEWTTYDNSNPLTTEIVDLAPGSSLPTYFDFKFTPKDSHELGSFVTKVYNFDPEVNNLGVYAEDFCIGTTENYIFIPATDPTLPTISILSVEPEILYNDYGRYLTLTGKGMTFFEHNSFRFMELRLKENPSVSYTVDRENMSISSDGTQISFYLSEYMEPGNYEIHLLWDSAEENRPDGVPEDIFSDEMTVFMTDDEAYRNDRYGVIAVTREANNTYKARPFKSESDLEEFLEYQYSAGDEKEVLVTLRGNLVKDNDTENYRISGNDSTITINNALHYAGNNFDVKVNGGSVEIAMDGKLTTVGAATEVRNGTAYIRFNAGTKYVIPVYNSKGETISGGSVNTNEDYLQLSWDGGYSFLQSVGGFLIDLRYGIFGRMNDTDGKTYDIISFGGGLDLSFMTPGGAQTARENQTKSSSWTYTYMDSTSGLDPLGLESWVAENPPEQKKVTKVSGGVAIHDILYGNSADKTGYLGINMDVNMTLPQIVSFLPNSMSGNLSVNTIGGYEIGVSGKAKAATFEMEFALVIKSNPSGAPIPDKLYFTLGGFEPGINVDGLGVFWLTGGGGGIDKLYDTIYGTDGLPPLTVLLNVQFDIAKIMTGSADLSLSLRSLGVTLSDVSLKFVEQARFLDGGSIFLAWYPNVEFSLEGKVNFLQLFKGGFSVIATEDLFEMMLQVAISLPSYIPVVGGMEIASAELGGGTEKMWGSVSLLQLIRLGFTYYWDSGEVTFTTSKSRSANAAYRRMMTPMAVDYNEETDETQYLLLGSNLEFVCGSGNDLSLTEEKLVALTSAKARSTRARAAGIQSNVEINQHLITLEAGKTYLLTVNTVNEEDTLTADMLNLQAGGTGENILDFYVNEGSVQDKQEASQDSNANMVGEGKDAVAYIAVEGSAQPYLLTATKADGSALAVNVGIIEVEALPELTEEVTAVKNGNQLDVTWNAENVTENTSLHISLSEEQGETADVLLAEITDTATIRSGSSSIAIPDSVPSGNYYVNAVIIEESKTYQSVQSKDPVVIVNAKAPEAADSVVLENCGNNKLNVKITDDFDDTKLAGYYIDVYEGEKLKDSGLYFTKEQAKNGEIMIGGTYQMMEYKTLENGDSYATGNEYEIGYVPGKSYSVSVRAAGESEDGNDTVYCSDEKTSEACILNEQQLPELTFKINSKTIPANEMAVSDDNQVELVIRSDMPVTGTLIVDGVEGTTYIYNEADSAFEEQLTLSDGEHILEFACENEQGDKRIVTQSVMVDTQAPVLLVEAPVTGESVLNGKVTIKASAEADAKYTFLIDGEVIGEENRDLSAQIVNGFLDMILNVPESMDSYTRTLIIVARDAAGNESRETVTLQNGDLIAKLANELRYVEIYADGEPVNGGTIDLSETKQAELSMMAVLKNGTKLDITELPGTVFEVAAGNAAYIDGNMVETTGAGGESHILGRFDAELGSGVSFVDSISVETGGQEIKYYTVTLNEGEGFDYVKEVNATKIEAGGSYRFKVTVKDGYSKTESFAVTANDAVLTADPDDNYHIENIRRDQIVSVAGIADVTAPTAEISVGNNIFKSFLNTITFGLFFKDTQTVKITAEDVGSGVAEIWYYVSDKPLKESEVKDASLTWTKYTDKFLLDGDGEYTVYAKAVDRAGNTVYVSSDGIVILTSISGVSGIEDGGVYYGPVTVTVGSKYVESITNNGETVILSEDGTFVLNPAEDVQTIVVTDKAGNQITMKVTVNEAEPEKDDQPSAPSTPTVMPSAPKTGDEAQILTWIAVAVFMAAGAGITFFRRRKTK